MNALIIPQDNGLFSISIHGTVVELDLTHSAALAALNIYNECAWEVMYG